MRSSWRQAMDRAFMGSKGLGVCRVQGLRVLILGVLVLGVWRFRAEVQGFMIYGEVGGLWVFGLESFAGFQFLCLGLLD